ncbi:tyrosine kinase catalytic domain protein [Rhizoctonia solani AG-3 Rhs1AP]|uniref:Tyrosine kinase catalytic domain protein n=2 Tax=Rhizoctonia solani AG-3 TaxID=1086053 RepID=A0A074S4B8_9AGAM|nr:tyrosine kinase catalytic domain protein [Rhizoctonia solani AG-3 Rhs1AP]KEP52415.1 tyrosine kinase catalytic domain protein [Rhizoctonia solani 123E]
MTVSGSDLVIIHPATSTQSRPEQISRKMSPEQMTEPLARRGLKDLTHEVDFQHDFRSFELGRGGGGSVYRGQLRDGRPVAIKSLIMSSCEGSESRGKYCKHAAEESYTHSKCNHPGVLEILGFALHKGEILLIFPWMSRGALTAHLKNYSVRDRLRFCIDLADTVGYLHSQGIVHGDIKTDNIILSETDDIKLADFGSAILTSYLTLDFTRTSSHLSYTIRFVAPEIVRQTSETHTTKSDVYSLGMTLLHILTGEPPYTGVREPTALAKALDQIPPLRPDAIFHERADDILWYLLLRCWNPDPNLRPTAKEVKQVLAAIQRDLSV